MSSRHSPVTDLYTKGTPVPGLTETGAGAARYSAPHGCLLALFHRPRPTTHGPGSPVIWRQTPATAPQPRRATGPRVNASWLCPFSGMRRAWRRQRNEKKQPCTHDSIRVNHRLQPVGRLSSLHGQVQLLNPPLAKLGRSAYTKREPRFLLLTRTGAGAARYSAPHGCLLEGYFIDPGPPRMDRGHLLSGVRRQQQHHSQGEQQGQE